MLKAGTTFKTVTIERAFLDITQFMRFVGCGVDTLSLSIQPNRMITGTLGIIGGNMTTATTPLGTVTDAGTAPPFDAFTGTLLEGGAANAIVTGITINLNNSLDPSYVILKSFADELTYGRSNVTGTISAKFNELDARRTYVQSQQWRRLSAEQ